ncbi:MAG: hypothetical protein EFT35_10245 [Methanophagales archaeon ANME-1-THS]|nr:MAG: hypothetical protein EFT35_10245 [Methanophagales archaeon ANME-1-THS]
MEEVHSADKAVEIALNAIRKAGWAFPSATTAKLEGEIWFVTVETLWGALTAAINAFALKCKGIIVREHKELKTFMRELSLERRDSQLSTAFKDAERLHANFYHKFLAMGDVVAEAPKVEAIIRKLLM